MHVFVYKMKFDICGKQKPSRLKKVVEKGYNIQHMHQMYIFNSMKNMFGEQIPSSQGLLIYHMIKRQFAVRLSYYGCRRYQFS